MWFYEEEIFFKNAERECRSQRGLITNPFSTSLASSKRSPFFGWNYPLAKSLPCWYLPDRGRIYLSRVKWNYKSSKEYRFIKRSARNRESNKRKLKIDLIKKRIRRSSYICGLSCSSGQACFNSEEWNQNYDFVEWVGKYLKHYKRQGISLRVGTVKTV